MSRAASADANPTKITEMLFSGGRMEQGCLMPETAPEATPRKRSRGRRVGWVLGILLGVVIVAFAGASWYASSELVDGMGIADYADDLPDTVVVGR